MKKIAPNSIKQNPCRHDLGKTKKNLLVRIDRLDYMETNPYHTLDSDLSKISQEATKLNPSSSKFYMTGRSIEQGSNKENLEALKPSKKAQDSGQGLAANAGTQINLHSFINTLV